MQKKYWHSRAISGIFDLSSLSSGREIINVWHGALVSHGGIAGRYRPNPILTDKNKNQQASSDLDLKRVVNGGKTKVERS